MYVPKRVLSHFSQCHSSNVSSYASSSLQLLPFLSVLEHVPHMLCWLTEFPAHYEFWYINCFISKIHNIIDAFHISSFFNLLRSKMQKASSKNNNIGIAIRVCLKHDAEDTRFQIACFNIHFTGILDPCLLMNSVFRSLLCINILCEDTIF